MLADDDIQIDGMEAEALAELLREKGQEDANLAQQLLQEAREVARKAGGATQRMDGMAEVDDRLYERLYKIVSKQITQLRVVLEGLEAKEKERVWVRNQNAGELDDTRLVDGATGERNIFKKRGNNNPLFGNIQKNPKRLRFVMDVSSSMARFNGVDRRLDRLCACTVMIMEAFQGLEHKYHYEIVGHSGESHDVRFVGSKGADEGSGDGMPRGRPERLAVIQEMYNHASFCMSGDHTLAAALYSVQQVVAEPGDDYYVFLCSDANLAMYGVSPKSLAEALLGDTRVNSYAIFIAGEAAAESLKRDMPIGHAHVVLDTNDLPRVFREIFSHSLLKDV